MDISTWGVPEWTLVFAVVSVVVGLAALWQNWKSTRRQKEVTDVRWEARISDDSILYIKNVGSTEAKSVRVACSAAGIYHETVEIGGKIPGGCSSRVPLPKMKDLREKATAVIEKHGAYSLKTLDLTMSHEAELVISWLSPRGVPGTQVVSQPHFKILQRQR